MPTAASYRVLIGLEIHVQLSTRTKMFARVANASGSLKPGEEVPAPNTAVDPVVLGLPGTLPVMNKAAVESSIKVGLALGCKINKHTKWDRKSYYYPDLPKNYQISQYDLPLCYEGELSVDGKAVRIRRAHLEEDAGKLLHEAPGGFRIDHSIVDLNRAGTPLLEIVTEPDLSTAKEVAAFAQELQRIVKFVGVSEAQMQLGHMRFEPNINLHITDSAGAVHKTAITEIKNLNSFSVLERATDYEIRRQLDAWESTGSLGKKSTYGWDEASGSTFHQRDKEEANDYRYFPDPDLMPVEVDDAWLTSLKAQVGEMPATRRARYIDALGLAPADAAILANDRGLGEFFEQSLAAGAAAKRAGNLIVNGLAALANRSGVAVPALGVSPTHLADVAKMIDGNSLAAASGVAVFEKLIESSSTSVNEVVAALGLAQSSDTSAIDAAIDAALAANPKSVADFKGGKQAAIGALVGSIMKEVKGLNPKVVQERLRERLSSE